MNTNRFSLLSCCGLGVLRGVVLMWFSMMMTVAHADDAPVYQFGVVPQFDSRTLYDIWTPILTELQKQTGVRFVLATSPSIPAFEKRVAQEEFDFAYMNPYHYLVARGHYLPLVRDVDTPLQGIVVVHRNNTALQRLSDLQGKVVDFPAPNALAASLMTRAYFGQQGIAIQPRYVKTHSSVYLNVALGQADAGGGILSTLEEQPEVVRDQLRILDRTITVASHPVVVNTHVSPALRERVRKAFLEMGKSAEGRALLAKIPVSQIGRAAPEDYAPIKRLGLEKYYVPN